MEEIKGYLQRMETKLDEVKTETTKCSVAIEYVKDNIDAIDTKVDKYEEECGEKIAPLKRHVDSVHTILKAVKWVGGPIAVLAMLSYFASYF